MALGYEQHHVRQREGHVFARGGPEDEAEPGVEQPSVAAAVDAEPAVAAVVAAAEVGE